MLNKFCATYARGQTIVWRRVHITPDQANSRRHPFLGLIRYNHKQFIIFLHPPSQCILRHKPLCHFLQYMPNSLSLTTLPFTQSRLRLILSSQQSMLYPPQPIQHHKLIIPRIYHPTHHQPLVDKYKTQV